MITALASDLELSVPTVTKYLKEMIEDKVVLTFGLSGSSHGRKPLIYGANPDAFYFVGVDIRRFSLHIALMNLTGIIIKEDRHDDYLFENTPASFDRMCVCLSAFLDSLGETREKVMRVSVNISGRVDPVRGYSHSIFNFEENDAPLAEIISQRVGVQSIINNDTQAMAYGGLMAGKGRNFSDFLFINASWGIGMGIIIGGKLYHGMNGYAGEVGHTNVFANEVICHCGKKGCLETEISGQALQRKFFERIKAGESSILSEKAAREGRITTGDIIKAANEEDTLCLDLLEKMGSELGRQLANLMNIFNPEALIIGGTLSLADDYFLSPIRLGIKKYSLKLINKDVKLYRSEKPDTIGVIGACMLARHDFFQDFCNQ